ncbi:MAG TPA: type II secretion system F family protein [Bryobacterales bacterium]|nr:type II secretion system F family protein [Bryobacterales bacterium]
MVLISSIILFSLLVGLLSMLGMNLWVRPKAAMDRLAGEVAASEQSMAHPSLAFREIMRRLGNVLPTSPKDSGLLQRRLLNAGFRNPNAVRVMYGVKASLAVALPLVVIIFTLGFSIGDENWLAYVLGAAAIGYLAPNEFLRHAAKKRQKAIKKGMANALDLLVVCVESGLGLDQAIMQVSKELQTAHPEIAEEFAIVNLEMRAGKRRVDALRDLGQRTGVDEVKKLVAVLVQADRFGTSIAGSLKSHSDYMRVQARQEAETKAAKMGVKLVFPIFFFILPSLFVVTVGPIIVRIFRELLPMMNR